MASKNSFNTIFLSALGAGMLLATSALQGQNARPQQRPPEVPKQVLENTNIRAAFSDRGSFHLQIRRINTRLILLTAVRPGEG